MRHDVRYALRILFKGPCFTAAAVLILSIGIAANTAVFSAVNSLLIRPLPFPDADRLVLLGENNPSKGIRGGTSLPGFLDWKASGRTIEDMAALQQEQSFTLSGDGEPERVTGARASASLLRVLGVKPVLGRPLLDEEERPGAEQAIVNQLRVLAETFR